MHRFLISIFIAFEFLASRNTAALLKAKGFEPAR